MSSGTQVRTESFASITETGFETEAKRLVAGLHTPEPAIFWTDLAASVIVCWTAFAFSIFLPAWSPSMLAAAAVATFAAYRALCFIHEISHLRKAVLPGFESAWNLLVGAPLLMPSFVYAGVHQHHHSLATYGTEKDPEYLPFSNSHVMSTVFLFQSLLIPAFLLLRFLVVSPVGLVWPGLHSWLVTHASSLSMNPKFLRTVTPSGLTQIRRWEVWILAFWGGLISAMAFGILPWRTIVIWYLITAVASFINTLRTLGAHRYESTGAARSRSEQLMDSLDHPGAFWTELWAPVGLRYHAMHHYFPGVPYHNLGKAYRAVLQSLPAYQLVSSPSLLESLRSLYERGRRAVAMRR